MATATDVTPAVTFAHGWYGSALAGATPGSRTGTVCFPGTGGSAGGRVDPASARIRKAAVSGSNASVMSGPVKSWQLVRSPQIARRQAEMLGSRTPVQRSRVALAPGGPTSGQLGSV